MRLTISSAPRADGVSGRGRVEYTHMGYSMIRLTTTEEIR